MHRGTRSDSGETLIEILMTVVILGTTVLAVIAALWSAVAASDYHRKQADADVAAKAYAEALRLYVSQLTAPNWCRSGGYTPAVGSYVLPSDFGGSVGGTVTVKSGDWGACPTAISTSNVHTPQFQTAKVTATTASGVVATQSIVLTPSWCWSQSASPGSSC